MPQRDIGVDPLLQILELSRKLAAPTELKFVLDHVIEAGRHLVGADRATVFLYDPERNELFATAATGEPEIRFPADAGIAGYCARTRAVVNIPDCDHDSRFNRAIDLRTGYRTLSLIAVPLVGLDGELAGVLQLLNSVKGCFDAVDERTAEILAGQVAGVIQRSRLLDERSRKLQMERDMAIAREIQQHLLPTQWPRCTGYDIHGCLRPADQTGGDIFDLIPGESADDDVVFLLADATGHGIGPALSVTELRGMVRMGFRLTSDLPGVLNQINKQLVDDLPGMRFITAFLGRLDPRRHSMDYYSAGQSPLLHYRAVRNDCETRFADGVPLGIFPELELDAASPFDMSPGDILLLATDGLFEARNANNEYYGSERAGEVLKQHRHHTAREIVAALMDCASEFSDREQLEDDITVLVVKRLPLPEP